jgi:hypothetical protein
MATIFAVYNLKENQKIEELVLLFLNQRENYPQNLPTCMWPRLRCLIWMRC